MKISCPHCSAEQDLPTAATPMARANARLDNTLGGAQNHIVCDNCKSQIAHGIHKTGAAKTTRPARRIIVVPSKAVKQATVAALEKKTKLPEIAGNNKAAASAQATDPDIGNEKIAVNARAVETVDSKTEGPEINQPDGAITFRQKWMNIAAVIGAILIFGGGLMVRDRVVSVLPNLSSLYKLAGLNINARGLEFYSVASKTETKNGGNILIIEGMIRNVSKSTVKVPAVRLLMRAVDQQEIYAWFYEPEQMRLEAGETMKFVTRMFGPPSDVRDIHLKFTERRSQQAKLN